ncbi:ornithine carbamoyltransferase [Brevibacterium jeotgali]|uniref:Ornithine carbamoyltransferase n=1 Tax=Brevibacterium jeotgali TaxID=1262550 RepID=A0A2H1L388_9MICO|nr:ornithine carbamoyltransferase [Brevibacterium jeotgali]TWC02574.1 ornithine carbamoyltransferase [Brevibacterium jeotgali]SMY11367.1 ornithine carbamoyltransferase [Brevibacterium jeotgali]
MTRHFLKDTDLSPDELTDVLDLAGQLKAAPYSKRPLEGPQTVAVFFDKTSTRTRVSFAAGVSQLGGSPLIINPGESQLGHKESIPDTARVLDRMVSAIVWRTFAQSGLEEMAEHSSVPVVNALSDDYHPCQILADLVTIREHRGTGEGNGLAGLTMSYYGDGANNMANSYALGGVNAGMHVRIAAPAGYQPADQVVAEAQELGQRTGGTLTITDDPLDAAQGAHVLVTDTWVSMGQDSAGRDDSASPFSRFQVTEELMNLGDDPIFLHCLPAYRGKEVAASVIDGPASVVFDEAENRLHAQKALLTWLLSS